jgi:hypothetical protein
MSQGRAHSASPPPLPQSAPDRQGRVRIRGCSDVPGASSRARDRQMVRARTSEQRETIVRPLWRLEGFKALSAKEYESQGDCDADGHGEGIEAELVGVARHVVGPSSASLQHGAEGRGGGVETVPWDAPWRRRSYARTAIGGGGEGTGTSAGGNWWVCHCGAPVSRWAMRRYLKFRWANR